MAEVVVQNRGPYDWKFILYKEGSFDTNRIHGTVDKEFIFYGRLNAPKNITLIDPTDWDRLRGQYKQIDELLSQTKDGLDVLEDIPTSYYDAAHFVGIERTRANTLRQELDTKVSEIESKDAEIEQLKEKLKSYGAKVK